VIDDTGVCQSVSLSVTRLRSANMAEQIEVLRAWEGDFWGPRNTESGVPIPPTDSFGLRQITMVTYFCWCIKLSQ